MTAHPPQRAFTRDGWRRWTVVGARPQGERARRARYFGKAVARSSASGRWGVISARRAALSMHAHQPTVEPAPTRWFLSAAPAQAVLLMQSDAFSAADRFTGYKASLSGPAGGVVGVRCDRSRRDHRRGGRRVGRRRMRRSVKETGGVDADVRLALGFDMGHVQRTCPDTDGVFDIVFGDGDGGVVILRRSSTSTRSPRAAARASSSARERLRRRPRVGQGAPGAGAATARAATLARRTPTSASAAVLPTTSRGSSGRRGPARSTATRRRARWRPWPRGQRRSTRPRPRPPAGRRRAPLAAEEVACGFVRVADEAMCRPIRQITEARGFDPPQHVLACFGGAGAQHVCAIARALGMRTAVVHAYAGSSRRTAWASPTRSSSGRRRHAETTYGVDGGRRFRAKLAGREAEAARTLARRACPQADARDGRATSTCGTRARTTRSWCASRRTATTSPRDGGGLPPRVRVRARGGAGPPWTTRACASWASRRVLARRPIARAATPGGAPPPAAETSRACTSTTGGETRAGLPHRASCSRGTPSPGRRS